MRKVHLAYPNSVRFCKSEAALVVTEPPATWSAVLSQSIGPVMEQRAKTQNAIFGLYSRVFTDLSTWHYYINGA